MKEKTLKCSGGVRWLCMVGGATVLVSAMATSASADIKYTQETRMDEEQNAKAPTSIITRMAAPNAERTDMVSNYGKMKVTQSTIRLCEKQQEIQIDDGLKIYTIKVLNEPLKPVRTESETEAEEDKEPKTGKVVAAYKVEYLGEEMVANFKTRHYMLTTDIQRTGCAGDGGMESKTEVWISDIKDATPCPPKYDPVALYAAMAQGNCKLDFEQKGDVEAYTKVYTGIVMRQKIYMGDKAFMTTEITSLSQAKLDGTPFVIPAGYKQVSAEEFQTQQSAVMMQAMMAGETPVGE